jgi:DNA invertase Pin-like site-specific DNA recombinase
MKKLMIGVVRVSTERQTSARNGIEAQVSEIEAFAAANGYELLEIVEESVSGKHDLKNRPVLKAAIQKCLKLKATLCVSKLDRLSRRAAFIMALMETKLKFVVAEYGEEVSPMMIHFACVVGEAERHAIGSRTKVALQAKKRREPDWTPGNPTNLKEAGAKGAAATSKVANMFAERLRPNLQRMRASGMTLYEIAKEFNENEVATARGGMWTVQSVSNVVRRLQIS